MALQQINWTQINTSLVPSGSIIDLGNETGSLNAVYADNLYVSGLSLTDFIGQAGTIELNLYTASLKDAIETTGSNLTVKGNLLVKGTTTAVDSTTVSIGDNIIELNGTAATNGGLLIKDPTAPSISGSLLWDTTNNKWIAGQLGTEKPVALLNTDLYTHSLVKYGVDGILRNSRISDDNQNVEIHLHDTGSLIIQGTTYVSGSIIIGHSTTTESDLHKIVIQSRLSSSLYPHEDNVYEIGSSSLRFKTVHSNTGSVSRIENLTNPSDGVWIQGIGNVEEYSSSIDTTILNLSSSLSSSTTQLSSSLSTRIDSLNQFSSSISGAIEVTGSNVTIKGDLYVKGTTTSVNSTTISLGDNIIELNGSEAAFGGLLIKDVTNPDQISGSLLWDSANNYWVAGQVGSEDRIILATELTDLSSSLSASIDLLSGSVSETLDQLTLDLNATNIWQQTGSFYGTNQNIQITGSGAGLMSSPDGSTSAKYALSISQSIHAANINVGIPTSNDWKTSLEGSYFNNFDKNTDVSEILRFVAGLLSSSAPDASPNTKTYSTYTKNSVNTTTGTALVGYVPQTTTNTTIGYLQGKGFATAGSSIFNGVTPIYTNSSYGHTYTSVAGGSTNVSSSVDSQLFGLGLLSSGVPTSFKVSGSFNFKFKDNSLKTDTATSSSNHLITQTGAGTTSGVTLAKINTANPAVIPAAYQDGKFAAIFSPTIYNGGASAVSSSGYYEITGSIMIASGSSDYTTPITTTTQIFYAPLTTISTNVGTNTITTGTTTVTATTAVSRSLSGAPYLSSATYTISSSISGICNPLYAPNSTIANIGNDGGYHSMSTGNYNGTIAANGTILYANTFYDSTGTTVRSTGTIPYETDIVKLNGLQTFTPTNATNIAQSSITPTTFTSYFNGRDFNNNLTQKTQTTSLHTAGTFGQPAASGSMAYYGRTQGGDTATALIEYFTGENYRIQVADNVLAFNGTAWSTSFGLYNLGNIDLQIKPGYLVKPGGTYGYWLTNPSNASDYKYYIRRFQTSGTKTSMTINLGQTLVNWGTVTNNSVSALVLFESSKNTIYTPARLYDPSNLLDNFTATKTANTDGQNPFGTDFALYGNTGGSLSSTTYTIPLRNGDGMTINASYDEIYVLVRYKGDPTPITSITVAFS